MPRWSLSLLLLLGACNCSRPSEPGRPYPALTPPTGAIGAPGDEPRYWSASGQWVAVCRGDTPKLLVGDDHEVDLYTVLVAGPRGRFVVISRAGQRILYDAVDRHERVLGRVGEVSQGSFDAREQTFAYRRSVDGREEVVVLSLDSGTQRVIESPLPSLTTVSLDPSGRSVWMTAWQSEDEDADEVRDPVMCGDRSGCDMGRMGRTVASAVLDLESPDAEVVHLEPLDVVPRMLGDTLVLDTDEAIEVISPEGRRSIASGDCDVVHSDWRAQTMLIGCQESPGSYEHLRWNDGTLSPIDLDWGHPEWSLGFHVPYYSDGVRGNDERWLLPEGPHVVQGRATQQEAHAFDGHLLLVAEDWVEIRDGATDTRVDDHDLQASVNTTMGPFVALRSTAPGHEGGWVIDVRTGAIVREHDEPALALARSGHVAVRDEDGRLRWR